MPLSQRTIAVLVASVLTGVMHTARADDAALLTHEIMTMDSGATAKGSGAVTGKIVGDFQSFAGSEKNATALVTGLRSGSEITLTQRGHRAATFTPPTRPMGYGNVSTSLALAQHQLAQQGITQPTPTQLAAALNGGTIFVDGHRVRFEGVLQMRADGMGWGQIAQQLGTKLGPVVSGIKSQNAAIATLPATKHPVQAGTTTTTTTTVTTSTSGVAGARGASEGKGIVNAAGGSSPGLAKGKDDAGPSTAAGKSSAPGRGIVSGTGQTAGPVSPGAGHSHGVVNAAGSGASTAGASGGGGGSGHGKAVGHNK